MSAAADPLEDVAPPPARARRGLVSRSLAGFGLAVLTLAMLGAGVRFGAATAPGRFVIVRLVDGLSLGPAGRMRLQGLAGDVFGRFSVGRLAIVDAKGAWLEARDVDLDWRPIALLARRVHARRLTIGDLVILRSPVASARPPSSPPHEAPLSVKLDGLTGRIETRPAFSQVAGDWIVRGGVDYDRRGHAVGRLDASSRLHAGDGVTLDFLLGEPGRLRLRGEAVEARGGALAGALGLAPDARFQVRARADGEAEAGAFTLDARSGGAEPIVARGRWSPEGATLTAQVALSASHLTRTLSDRIGPKLAVSLAAHLRPDRLYDITLDAVGAEGQARATGPVDVRRRRTPGLDLAMQVSHLGLWTHPVEIGPAHARGVFSGDLASFTYKGVLAGERLAQSGYAVARLQGPAFVAHDGRGWTFGGHLQGDGAAGSPFERQLLGASPSLDVEGSYGADNRLLIRSLHVVGPNLRVDATGAQGLFGGFSFEGQAAVASLNGLRPGARGGLDATWTAASARNDPAWRIDVVAQGRGFASGAAEPDRLLGSTPRLSVRGSFKQGVFDLASVMVQGAHAQAHLHGALGRAGALGFDVDWSAEGPFDVGPVEVAGRAQGGGRIDGSLSAPHADLHADLTALELDRLVISPAHLTLSVGQSDGAIDGRIALTGATPTGAASARADFRWLEQGLDLRDVAADAGGVKLVGNLVLRGGEPSTANLTLQVGPGLFLASGRLAGTVRITSHADGADAVLALQGENLTAPGAPLTVQNVALQGAGPIDRLRLHLSAKGQTPLPWQIAGNGVLAKVGGDRDLSFAGAGRLRGAEFHTITPLDLRLGPEDRVLRGRLALAGGSAEIEARQNLAGSGGEGQGLAVRVNLASVGLAPFSDDYVGKLTSTLTLHGAAGTLAGVLDATLTDARASDAPANLALNGDLHAALAGSQMTLRASASNAQGLRAETTLALPAVATAQPFRIAIDRTRPMSGAFDAHGELRSLWDLLAGGERTLAGQLVARGSVGGTLNQPDVEGSAVVTKGAFKDGVTGLALQNLAVQADFGHNLVEVRQFAGSDGRGGALAGAGRVSLVRDGASTFQLKLTRFQLIDNDLGRATASGAVDVTRDASGGARLTGKLRIDRGDITTKTPTPTGVVPMDVEEINLPGRSGEPAGPAVQPGAGLVALDVAVTAPGGVLVRGKGIDAELSLDAHVGGSTATPALSGQARIVRGVFDFSGKRFDFDAGSVVKLASKPADIRLDLKAERNDPALDAIVRVRGTAARPEISLSSQPVLPQDEILSRVLFGVSASQLSPFQAAQLATALASLATGGGFDILANLRQFAGLDRLSIGGDASGPAISGGKYLTHNVYLELTGASTGRSQTATTAAQIQRTGPSAEVEWRVRRNLSLVSQVWAGGDARLSVRFRRNY